MAGMPAKFVYTITFIVILRSETALNITRRDSIVLASTQKPFVFYGIGVGVRERDVGNRGKERCL
jgi:hypothetical protein